MRRFDDVSTKIVFVGLAESGKSSFLLRLVNNHFMSIYRKTIGVDFRMKKIKVNAGKEFIFPIWDLAGNQDVKSAIPIYFGNAALIVFFIDLKRIDLSISYIKDWNESINKYTDKDTKFAVVFTKLDVMEEENMPSKNELRAYTQQAFQLAGIAEEQILTKMYFVTSTKNRIGIEEAFQHWGECLMPVIVPRLILGTSQKESEIEDADDEPLVSNFFF